MTAAARPETREAALATALDALASWRIVLCCRPCRKVRDLHVWDLAARAGSGATVADVLPRLRCQTCRTEAGWVKLTSGLRTPRTPDPVEIMLRDG